MYIGVHVKYPLFWSDFRELEFSHQIFEIYSNTVFRKHRTVKAALFREDRWTDMTKFAFRNFAKEPKSFDIQRTVHRDIFL
jgi:hypothetical protein